MQTKFTEEQLRDPDNFANEKVFKKCVHCGMCNATCPTHQLLGDELDGPRGRIYLIKDMLEITRAAVDEKAEVEENFIDYQNKIPASFWAELKEKKLIDERSPIDLS